MGRPEAHRRHTTSTICNHIENGWKWIKLTHLATKDRQRPLMQVHEGIIEPPLGIHHLIAMHTDDQVVTKPATQRGKWHRKWDGAMHPYILAFSSSATWPAWNISHEPATYTTRASGPGAFNNKYKQQQWQVNQVDYQRILSAISTLLTELPAPNRRIMWEVVRKSDLRSNPAVKSDSASATLRTANCLETSSLDSLSLHELLLILDKETTCHKGVLPERRGVMRSSGQKHSTHDVSGGDSLSTRNSEVFAWQILCVINTESEVKRIMDIEI